MFELTKHIDLTVQESVLKVFHYYALFNYPLKLNEIHGSCSLKCGIDDIREVMELLLSRGYIYSYKGYYSNQSNIIELVDKRERSNAQATQKIEAATRAGKIIGNFPFVKFVGISGSLSKGCLAENDDFDFFIVTNANRLWISYTLLHLFKKLTFILGKQHHFCMNYFIDTESLALSQKNIFTAIELTSLIPIYGSATYHQLLESNAWRSQYLPNNYVKFKASEVINDNRNIIKSCIESLFMIALPGKLNQMLMQIIDGRRRKKWKINNLPAENYDLAFNTSLHISKNHRADRHKKIMKKLSDVGYK